MKKSALLTVAATGVASSLSNIANAAEKATALHSTVFSLPPLPYAYDALEPHIDKMTMEIHHTKHHQAYITNLNKACEEAHINSTIDELVANVSQYSATVRNNGGGHWNHSFFWKLMKPHAGGPPVGGLGEAIKASFNSFDEFKTKFNEAGMKRFGSGWAWLVKDKSGMLQIGSTPNQDNPLMDVSDFKGHPVIGIDVWEHAYYLKYQNKRADYLTAWWNLINWDEAAKNFMF